MKAILGKYASAVVLTDEAEDYALAQIQQLCNQSVFHGSRIRVMPDVHPGKVGTIGFTATVKEGILPAVVGIDIGCGMTITKLRGVKREFQKVDTVIRESIPAGFQIRRTPHRFAEGFDFSRLHCSRSIRMDKAACSIGTLGGGNHFIELDKDSNGELYALIHSGSRHLGKEVAEYYMREGQKALEEKGNRVPFELTWLTGRIMEDYLHDVNIVQEFASLNRSAILDELLRGMKWKVDDTWSSVHNYVEYDEEIGERVLRKGAIAAHSGERVIIPVNMKEGVILGIGKGNREWNCSAPHGAGRIQNRETIRKSYTVSQFKKEMKGIYSTCVSAETLDEAPFAYRSLSYLQEAVRDTVEIKEILKPVYNYKAGSRDS